MKKLIYIILALFLVSACYNRKRAIKKERCAESLAFEADKESGIVKLYEAGPKGFSDTYQRLMLENYNIEIIKTDLFMVTQEMSCYNQFSLPYITEKYGDTIFTQNKIKANQMDRDGLGDRIASINGKSDSISIFFYQRIDPQLYTQFIENDSRNRFSLYARLLTDEQGKVYDLYESNVKKYPLDSALIAVAKQVPHVLIPALDNGLPAKGSVQIYFNFDEHSIKLYEDFHNE